MPDGADALSAISQCTRSTMVPMSALLRRPLMRWLVPLLVAVVLAAGGSVVGVLAASAGNPLPPRSAAQLLVDVQRARLDGLSGTIVQNTDLGLPGLPGVGGAGSSDMTSLVSGSHTLRLWYAGPGRIRLALLGSLGESDVIRNGADLWTWSSTTKSATHRALPKGAGDAPSSLASGSPLTPQQAASAALKAIDPTTAVTTDGTARVARRSAYELVLRPRTAGSLVDSVHIAIDGKTHVPLRVRIFAKGASKPSFEVGFTHFDPTAPTASMFRFNPPPGTKVTQSTGMPGHRAAAKHLGPGASLPRHGLTKMSGSGDAPRVVGSGWTSVVVAKVPAGALAGAAGGVAAGAGPGMLTQVLKSLPKVSGSWGSGHLLQGTLFSALLTDDGRVAVGAVPPSALYAALAR